MELILNIVQDDIKVNDKIASHNKNKIKDNENGYLLVTRKEKSTIYNQLHLKKKKKLIHIILCSNKVVFNL